MLGRELAHTARTHKWAHLGVGSSRPSPKPNGLTEKEAEFQESARDGNLGTTFWI